MITYYQSEKQQTKADQERVLTARETKITSRISIKDE
jgi:hypothetical protein